MLDLNIPWPTQTFADAQRAGNTFRQLQSQFSSGSGTTGSAASTSAQDSEAPLSKKQKKKQQQQQQQKQPQPPPSAPAPASQQSSQPPPPITEWDPLDDLPHHDQLRLRLLTVNLASLGYRTCAFNHTFSQPTRFDPNRHANPFSSLSAAASGSQPSTGKGKHAPSQGPTRPIVAVPFPELDPRFRGSSSTSTSSKGKQRAASATHLSLDPSLLDPGSSPHDKLRITQLHRLTLPLDDSSCSSAPGQGHGLVASAGPALQSYDLLAVTPTTESSFSTACLSLAELKPFGIDIISLDLSAQPRLPHWVKRSLVKATIQLGVVFEINYSAALPSSSGSVGVSSSSTNTSASVETARRNLIAATRSLLLFTKGTNVILSSGARDAMQLRAPRDVINLFGAILGMGETAARHAVLAGPEAVVRRARARKEVWKGIIGPVQILAEPSTKLPALDAAQQATPSQTGSAAAAAAAAAGPAASREPGSSDAVHSNRKQKRKRDSAEIT
ncbi:RNA-binding RNA processing protein rpp1 [Tilletia horrida]|uniref:RNA-binding RNA processing protein rpp1 n=1 Tax=Tilletia horrida TaxID=155126 RepID=A0AAN6JSV2_9BASI|nr:RNA-binding RNA processing protein rpp1 [Tilletia horrida]KAK0554113.1 RNA-binding RNA processing protein rpp1 [Tilletia horrida]KAK0568155.1 RNA-binding RNA processing protein rpp1 [Tilletia horrida]